MAQACLRKGAMMTTGVTGNSAAFVMGPGSLPEAPADSTAAVVLKAQQDAEQAYETYLKEWDLRIRRLKAVAERAAAGPPKGDRS